MMQLCKPILALLFVVFSCGGLSAQYEAQLVALINKKVPIVIEAPFPFVEVSRVLPEAFAQRRLKSPPGYRLISWYIPALSVKEQLNEKSERYRSLQIQILKEMEEPGYGPDWINKQREDTMQTTRLLAEEDTDTLFSMLDLSRLKQQDGAQVILGAANLGPDSFTLCIATAAVGKDLRGGREIESTVACVTYILLNEKILILTASGPEISAKELRNTMRLTREWIVLLRAHNNASAPGRVAR